MFSRLTGFVMVCLALSLVGCIVGTGEGESLGVDRQAASGGRWCVSSEICNEGFYCTTEDGDCLTPPSCRNQPCIAVCYGRCARAEEGEPCGDVICDPGLVCCNESCGICTEPGGYCTDQYCEPANEL